MPKALRNRLHRGRPRGRRTTEEAAKACQILFVLELEDLEEPIGRDESVKRPIGVDNGDAASAAPRRITCRCLEVGLRLNLRRLLPELADQRLRGRGQQPLDSDDTDEARSLDERDLGHARELPVGEHRSYFGHSSAGGG